MNPLNPLLTLMTHAERERDEAMALLQRALDGQLAASNQAEQLVNYRRDYEQRWGAEFSRKGQIELVLCYQGFMTRLSQAVDQQQRVVLHTDGQVERARQTLREHELKVASLGKLIERRRHDVNVAIERREQKATDEFAARSAWNRTTGNGGLNHGSNNPM